MKQKAGYKNLTKQKIQTFSMDKNLFSKKVTKIKTSSFAVKPTKKI